VLDRVARDITEITGAVSRRNVHAAAKRDCQMCEVSANTYPLLMTFGGCPVTMGMEMSKLDLIVNVVANGLHSLPASATQLFVLP
jgi:hypothetical protein